MKKLAAILLMSVCAIAHATVENSSGEFSEVTFATSEGEQKNMICQNGKIYKTEGGFSNGGFETYAAVCRSMNPYGGVNPMQALWIAFHEYRDGEEVKKKDVNYIGIMCRFADKGWACREWFDVNKLTVNFDEEGMKFDDDSHEMQRSARK